MVKKLRLLDTHLFQEKRKLVFKTSGLISQEPIVLSIVPDIYLCRQMNSKRKTKNKQEPQLGIVLNALTQEHIDNLSAQSINVIQVNYWPMVLSTLLKGCYLINISKEERAFFYHDDHLTFFQRLRQGDIRQDNGLQTNQELDGISQFLKRYRVSIPDKIPEVEPFLSLFSFLRLMCRFSQMESQGPIHTLQKLFFKQRKSYYHRLKGQIACVCSYGIVAFVLVGQSIGYTQRLEEIEKLQQAIVPLKSEERAIAARFDQFAKLQENHHSIAFDFAYTIMNHWCNQVVITSMQWQPSSTRYTIVFNPEYQEKIENFVDWMEGQPSSIELAEKGATNGTLHILVKNQ